VDLSGDVDYGAADLRIHNKASQRSLSALIVGEKRRQWGDLESGSEETNLVTPDKDSYWDVPPALDESQRVDLDWGFDMRPDCSYWLSLRGFNAVYRAQVQNCAYVIKDRITCPYLTIEFKRDGQVAAAAGSVALFNRCRLRKTCVETLSRNWELDDAKTLKHYALKFIGPSYEFWMMSPVLYADGTWNGCTMTRLFGYVRTEAHGVREFANWINEIHRWGMSVHGPACGNDVKTILRGEGIRTSDVQLRV